jgi:cytochrome c-type biogenesis protein CcmH/NrfG
MNLGYPTRDLVRALMDERQREADRARLARQARQTRRQNTSPARTHLTHLHQVLVTALVVVLMLSGAALTLLLETVGFYHP